jgi:HlyD family secretion protein
MVGTSNKIFRDAATERLSSVEQFDQLVAITRPFDWVAAGAMALGLIVLVTRSVVGKIPTRVEGEGILLSSGGRVVDAVASVAGRLASIDVAVGDEVTANQVNVPIFPACVHLSLACRPRALRSPTGPIGFMK